MSPRAAEPTAAARGAEFPGVLSGPLTRPQIANTGSASHATAEGYRPSYKEMTTALPCPLIGRITTFGTGEVAELCAALNVAGC
jgi:hypothetical protein